MASVNFSEKEYHAVCGAAVAALRMGKADYAAQLNELASKMNKGLSGASNRAGSDMGHARTKWRAPGPIDKELGILSPSGDSR